MNQKLYAVAQLILKELDQIDEIIEGDGEGVKELYFTYKDTAFSIMKRDESQEFGEYSLYLYPKVKNIHMANEQFAIGDPDNIFMLSIHASEGNNCRTVLSKVYLEILEKYLGLDEIFDTLLS